MTIYKFKTARFSVTVCAEAEVYPDLSWDEDGEVRRRIAIGELQIFCVATRVFYKGNLVAEGYLGDCIYESPEAFRNHLGIRQIKLPNGGVCGSYFSDGIRQAIAEARVFLTDFPILRS
jgi:hypothetical protein